MEDGPKKIKNKIEYNFWEKKNLNYKLIKSFGNVKKEISIVLTLWQTKPHNFKCDSAPFITCHFKVIAKIVAQMLCPLTFFLLNKLKSQS